MPWLGTLPDQHDFYHNTCAVYVPKPQRWMLRRFAGLPILHRHVQQESIRPSLDSANNPESVVVGILRAWIHIDASSRHTALRLTNCCEDKIMVLSYRSIPRIEVVVSRSKACMWLVHTFLPISGLSLQLPRQRTDPSLCQVFVTRIDQWHSWAVGSPREPSLRHYAAETRKNVTVEQLLVPTTEHYIKISSLGSCLSARPKSSVFLRLCAKAAYLEPQLFSVHILFPPTKTMPP